MNSPPQGGESIPQASGALRASGNNQHPSKATENQQKPNYPREVRFLEKEKEKKLASAASHGGQVKDLPTGARQCRRWSTCEPEGLSTPLRCGQAGCPRLPDHRTAESMNPNSQKNTTDREPNNLIGQTFAKNSRKPNKHGAYSRFQYRKGISG